MQGNCLFFSLPQGQNTLWGTTRPLSGETQWPARELQADGIFGCKKPTGFCVKNNKYMYVQIFGYKVSAHNINKTPLILSPQDTKEEIMKE
jgi:hypothetical protein